MSFYTPLNVLLQPGVPPGAHTLGPSSSLFVIFTLLALSLPNLHAADPLPTAPTPAAPALPTPTGTRPAPKLSAGKATPGFKTSAPVKDFRLPTFNREGIRTSQLHAGTALLIGQQQIDITNLKLTLFTGASGQQVESILTSPQATALTDRQIVQGPSALRLERPDLILTGENWTYNHLERHLLIQQKTHVIFRGELSDIIK